MDPTGAPTGTSGGDQLPADDLLPNDGLLSLRQILVGGLLVLGLLFTSTLASLGGPHLPTPGAAMQSSVPRLPVATAGDDAGAIERDGLRVAVRGPVRLVPGRASPLEIRVTAPNGVIDPQRRRLLVTFDLDLEPEGRGWVVVGAQRLLTSPAALARERVELLGFGELPCTEHVGTLTVRARELVDDGRSGSVVYPVPGASCPAEDVPPAPESLGLQQRVWFDGHSDWRAQVRGLLAPAPRPAPAPVDPAPAPTPTPPPPPAPEPQEPEEPDEDDERDEQEAPEAPEEPDERDREAPAEPEPDEDDASRDAEQPPADRADDEDPAPDREAADQGDTAEESDAATSETADDA